MKSLATTTICETISIFCNTLSSIKISRGKCVHRLALFLLLSATNQTNGNDVFPDQNRRTAVLIRVSREG